jgi:tRNA A-37 threonylcarbamoyl transferase component Bud32
MVLNLQTETVFTNETTAAQPPLPIEEIAPHFPQLEIVECLGRCGMGVVYKARQKTLNRLVALKLLAPERVSDAKFAERFTREAQALAALNHPNIVTIHDFGQAGGFYFLLMEFVDGVNLRQLLRARKFTPEEALAIVPPLCEALQFAHERGIVHRDIKPENLLLDKAGRVKIADFGIAKMLGPTNVDGSPLGGIGPEGATQVAVGTRGYNAPEQESSPQRVDSRADIYSLGVVFYEILTGELPGKRIEPPSRKVQIDVRLDEIVLRALEKSPERRWQTAEELRTRVETIVTDMGSGGGGRHNDATRAEPAGVGANGWSRLSRVLLIGAIAVPTLLLIGVALLVFNRASAPAPNIGGPVTTPFASADPNRKLTDQEIQSVGFEEWFNRIGRESEFGLANFTALEALQQKAREGGDIRVAIIRLASETIDDTSQNSFKRWQCCYVLSGIGDERGIPAITRALKDNNETVRGVAACALGAFDHPDAQAALVEAANSESNPGVQEWIQKALRGEFQKKNNPRHGGVFKDLKSNAAPQNTFIAHLPNGRVGEVSADASSDFQQVVHRTIYDADDGRTNLSMIDLDSGKVFSESTLGPESAAQPFVAAFEAGLKAMRREGVDLWGDTSGKTFNGFEMVVVPAEQPFDAVSAEHIMADKRLAGRAAKQVNMTVQDVPATYLFKTREGGRGVLEVIRFSTNLENMDFRYKLVPR